jgi:Zn finger protein HypA/HybF involved in hydrogenase expression
MPCYRCARVQTDPVKGASPWAVGVKQRQQILVCPDCQVDFPDWSNELDTCPACGSTRLRLMLGSVVCRACGADS